MTNLEKAKELIKQYAPYITCGIFNNSNWAGDQMENIYCGNKLIVSICYKYEYVEVFGLTEEEFQELKKYYYEVIKNV